MSTEQGGLSAGSDYGYDLAHDDYLAHDVAEAQDSRPQNFGRSRPDAAAGLPSPAGDLGYDEAHDLPRRRPS